LFKTRIPKILTKPVIPKISKKGATDLPRTFHNLTIRPMVLDLFRSIASMRDDGMLVANLNAV
jgi:hypothetical protein